MKWFYKTFETKPLEVCAACGVVFDPAKVESCDPWNHLCYEHRKPHIDTERRRKVVVEWANRNWTKLEKQATKENSEDEDGHWDCAPYVNWRL